MKALAGAVSALALMTVISAANAATIQETFSFMGANSGYQDSLGYMAGDLSLTVTGTTTSGATAKVATWTGHGLGVKHNQNDGHHTIDSFGLDDLAVLSFNKEVTILSLGFGYISKGSTFDLLVDGSEVLSAVVSSSYTFGEVLAGMVFGVGAGSTSYQSCKDVKYWSGHKWKWKRECSTKTIDSSFKLTSITVSYDKPDDGGGTGPDVPPVPLPAAGWAMLAALGGLAGVRKLRKSA
jgi:opacity protein-like surface antigen